MAEDNQDELGGKSTLALDSRKQREFEDKVKRIRTEVDDLTPGVIYLGHIPHGFYEDQIRDFFCQFGTVNRVRLSRNKKTARSKGYAFVEFACDEVAKIVAETMHNYMMFGKLLKCHVVPKEKLHPKLWKGANEKFRYVSRGKNEIKRQNREKNEKEYGKQINNVLLKERKKRKKMKDLGIDYDFPGYASEVKAKRPKHKRFDDDEELDSE
ncbi:MKI67 FHA domain-interacting nucleolar phosphoprotein-like [Montipora capricornis]|uniref:MKI67 FHA domain-interacting nucleolar phosphoprotein-like n=1 Tax=Montipora capricornis TaxID=246305 RepID=UPI0035F11BA4